MRAIVKISGELLAGPEHNNIHFGIGAAPLEHCARELKALVESGVEVAVVVGGGNFFRGATQAMEGMNRAQADHIGMLGTVMNALALQDVLSRRGVPARVMSAIPINKICENYIRGKALHHLSKGRIAILAAGTGNPLFTTDTAASLRAAELNADILAKFVDPGLLDGRISTTVAPGQLMQSNRYFDSAGASLCRDAGVRITFVAFDAAKSEIDSGILVSAIAGMQDEPSRLDSPQP